MGEISTPTAALLIVAVTSRHEAALAWSRQTTAAAWGDCALQSPAFSFSETDYYEATMGTGLHKQFLAFQQLIDSAQIAALKKQTNAWEAEYTNRAGHAESRPLNLDPGYITLGKLVLASTKDHTHRIYLSDGIYAEVTLYYKDKRWWHREWTYPDYRRDDYQQFFSRCRDYLKQHTLEGTAGVIWLVVGSIVPSLLICLVVGYLIRHFASTWGLLDRPSQRKDHRSAVPTGGGVAIWAGMMTAFVGLQIAVTSIDVARKSSGMSPGQKNPDAALHDSALGQLVDPHIDGLLRQLPKLWTLLAAATVMMLLGLADDRFGLDWRLRMSVQAVVAVFVVWQGWRLSLFIDAPLVMGAISVMWIVGLVNTFNMLDNMDGLSAGVAAIAATLLAAVILTAPDPITKGPQLFVGGFLLVLVGALLGFLWHNWPPARLFMGDAGSYLIGFCLATITISATFAGEGLPRHAILAPLCVLAVPIYDTITVVWIRLREGRSPFHADRNHISHRLVDLGLSKRQAVTAVYAATAGCGAGAFFLHKTDTAGALLILSLIAAVLVGIAAVELTVRKRRAAAAAMGRTENNFPESRA